MAKGDNIPKRWNVDDELKSMTLRTVRDLLSSPDTFGQTAGAKLAVAMEAQNQADDARREKYERIDAGLATEATELVIDIPSVRTNGTEQRKPEQPARPEDTEPDVHGGGT